MTKPGTNLVAAHLFLAFQERDMIKSFSLLAIPLLISASPSIAQDDSASEPATAAQPDAGMQRAADRFLQDRQTVQERRDALVSRRMNSDRQGRFRAQAQNFVRNLEHADLPQQTVSAIRDRLLTDALQVAAYVAPDGNKKSLADDRALAAAAVRFSQRQPTVADLVLLSDDIVLATVESATDENFSDGYSATVVLSVTQVFSGSSQVGERLVFRQVQPVGEPLPGDASAPTEAAHLYVLSRGYYEHASTGSGDTPSSNQNLKARMINTMRKQGAEYVPFEYSSLRPIPETELTRLN